MWPSFPKTRPKHPNNAPPELLKLLNFKFPPELLNLFCPSRHFNVHNEFFSLHINLTTWSYAKHNREIFVGSPVTLLALVEISQLVLASLRALECCVMHKIQWGWRLLVHLELGRMLIDMTRPLVHNPSATELLLSPSSEAVRNHGGKMFGARRPSPAWAKLSSQGTEPVKFWEQLPWQLDVVGTTKQKIVTIQSTFPTKQNVYACKHHACNSIHLFYC